MLYNTDGRKSIAIISPLECLCINSALHFGGAATIFVSRSNIPRARKYDESAIMDVVRTDTIVKCEMLVSPQ